MFIIETYSDISEEVFTKEVLKRLTKFALLSSLIH